MVDRTCSIDGCDRPHCARGWCKRHWWRWSQTGDPTGYTGRTNEDRFLARVERTDGCWLWRGGVNSAGYGTFYWNGRKGYAHRFSHEHFVGPIADELHVDHLCHTPLCVNPEHLEAVTALENLRRRRPRESAR